MLENSVMTNFQTVISSAETMSYWGNRDIKSVRLEEGVRSIGECAFGFSALQEIELPSSVRAIGSCAFAGLLGLRSITIPEGATTLGNMVFAGCAALEKVVLPSTLMETGSQIFYECVSLKRIEVPASVFKRFQSSDWVREHDQIIIIVVDNEQSTAVVKSQPVETIRTSDQPLTTGSAMSVPVINATKPDKTEADTLQVQREHETTEISDSSNTSILQERLTDDLPVEKLELSKRAANGLKRNKIFTINQLCECSVDDLMKMPSIGRASVQEIRDRLVSLFARRAYADMSAEDGDSVKSQRDDEPAMAVRDHDGQIAAVEDISLESLKLSARSYNGLVRAGIYSVTDLLNCSEADLLAIKNLGKYSVNEILRKIDRLREKALVQKIGMALEQLPEPIRQALKYYHCVVDNVLASQLDEVICEVFVDNPGLSQEDIIAAISENERAITIGREIVFNQIAKREFFGLQRSEISECLPAFLGDSYINACIDSLRSDERVVWNYGRAIRKYRSANELINEISDDRIKNVIYGRKQGKTLAEIAAELSLTRERVRQIESKFWRQIKTNPEIFAEDKYLPLYNKYRIDAKTFRAVFGEARGTWYIVSNRGDREDKAQPLDLESVVYDESIVPELREAISQFFKSIENASCVQIGNDMIPARREDLENYILAHYCHDEMSVDDFFDLYNTILEKAGCKREGLFATESVRRTRENRLADFKNVLWAYKRRLRYYDAERYDLNALFRKLKLDRFQNIEISARKLMLENPELMMEYDIRNEYELHNLMKKHGADEVCGDLVFGKMPMLQFGTVDRTKFIIDMLFGMAPISKEEFFSAVSEATGIPPELIGAKPEFVSALDVYLHDGMLTINSDPMPDGEMNALLEVLTENCYTIDEVRAQYMKLTGKKNTDLVSPYNLKRMGFKVFSGYILRNSPSAAAFFEGLLMQSEIVDYADYAKRFTSITEWSVALNKLKDEFKVIEFAPQQVIRMDRLQRFGVTRDGLMAFCDSVYAYTEEGEYFTITSIRKDGFTSPLFDLGFEDWFYSSILREDNRFGFRRMGEWKPIIVFCRDVPKVTRKNFIAYVLDGESEDIDVLLEEIKDTFGVIIDKYDIYQIIAGSDLYYDSTMGKVYSDKKQYYEEV